MLHLRTRFHWSTMLLLAVGNLCLQSQTAYASHEDALAYITASSEQRDPAHPGHFKPINLLDNDPATLWCEAAAGTGEGQEIHLSFKTPQTVDHVKVTRAAVGHQVMEVRLSNGSQTVQVPVGTSEADSTVELETPLSGKEFTFVLGTVQESGQAAKQPTCLADITLLHGTHPLYEASQSGNSDDRTKNRLLGTWNASPLGAPESVLTFNLDGTWTWLHEPLLEGERRVLEGTYQVHQGQLRMRLKNQSRWTAVSMHLHEVLIDADEMGAPVGNYVDLQLGDTLGADLAGHYNNARF